VKEENVAELYEDKKLLFLSYQFCSGSDEITLILHAMKKVLFLLVLILTAGCNREVCPAYTDSVNKVRSTIFQSGSVRADGIHRVYRDAPHKK
jgi:hypothetical protein